MIVMKKAQGAGGAAALVSIIALMIVLYILIIPAEERDLLLNDTAEEGRTSKTIAEEILVFEHPGLLDYLKETEREHSIPSVNLYTETNAVSLKDIESIYIKNGWFAEKAHTLEFLTDDLENTNNILLSFNIKQTRGRLIIIFNGEELFNSPVALGNIEPLELPKKFLKKTNLLELSVSGVGAAFWRLNEYNLEEVKVTADVTDVNKRTSENIFIVSSTEKENLDETRLRFLPDCLASEAGKLTININNKEVYSAVPDCGLPSTIPFLPEYIRSGENKITFSAAEGRYFVDYITIKSKLREIAYPLYYFELDEDQMEEINAGDSNVTLKIEFVNGDNKRADIIINGHKAYMDTYDSEYERVIDVFVEEGNNYVQIQPKTVINIVNLKVMYGG